MDGRFGDSGGVTAAAAAAAAAASAAVASSIQVIFRNYDVVGLIKPIEGRGLWLLLSTYACVCMYVYIHVWWGTRKWEEHGCNFEHANVLIY